MDEVNAVIMRKRLGALVDALKAVRIREERDGSLVCRRCERRPAIMTHEWRCE